MFYEIDSSGNKLEKKFTLNVNEQRKSNNEQNKTKTLLLLFKRKKYLELWGMICLF